MSTERIQARRWSWLVWVWVGLAAVLNIADVVSSPTGPAVGLRVYGVLIGMAAPISGALIVWKRPSNRIGWVLLLGGLYFPVQALSSVVDGALPRALEPWAAWAGQVMWAASIPPMVVFVPLLFPDGHLASPRWRWAAVAGVIGVTGMILGNAVDPGLLRDMGMRNPVAFPGADVAFPVLMGIGLGGFLIGLLAGLVSVGSRFRRSRGVVRLQLRWLFVGVASAFVAWLVAVGQEIVLGRPGIGGWIFATGFTMIPIAVVVAVLRYRLYDIDRVVSRTVSYAVTILALAGIYAGAVVGLGTILRGLTGGAAGDLTVAASTLLAAAAFVPVRRRVHAVVDRRFNRSRYDAARTIEAFAVRLRDEVDLATVVRGLTEVASETMRPAQLSVWLPTERAAATSGA